MERRAQRRGARIFRGLAVEDDGYRILKLRAEILELGSAIRQLRHAGLDDAAAQLLIARKRAQLEQLARAGTCRPDSEVT